MILTKIEIIELSGAILFSMGGASAILFGFSSWLGKVWANRFMEKEKSIYLKELEAIKIKSNEDITKIKTQSAENIEMLKSNYQKEIELLKNNFVQETESYKIKLKKSEFIFQKQFDALSELTTINFELLGIYSRPDMDWEDACDEIVSQFHIIEKNLLIFLSKHGAILPTNVKDLVISCKSSAGSNKFEYDTNINVLRNEASDFYDNIKKAEELMLNSLMLQVII